MEAVATDSLTRKFGRFTAVDRITLNISAGEIFGFLGANGAGKTTAIRMLCGLLKPTSGSGRVLGFDIYRDSEQIKKRIGYMSQKFSLYRDLTGRENLRFYGSIYRLGKAEIRSRIAELSNLLDLADFIDLQAGRLPAGWKQRLALAASLLHRPAILFLDEPTAGVDPLFRRRFWELLYRLADDGTTLFVTTHYMDEAEYCQRISIMHRGKMVVIGTPAELVARYGRANLEETFIGLIGEGDLSETDKTDCA